MSAILLQRLVKKFGDFTALKTMDLVIEDILILELKTAEKLLPIHEAQLLTYLKLSGLSLGLLINFNVPVLRDGIRRIASNYSSSSAPPRLRGSNPS